MGVDLRIIQELPRIQEQQNDRDIHTRKLVASKKRKNPIVGFEI
jgi:hypothetical protein